MNPPGRGKRNNSGPLSWSRLKPAPQDELMAYGLPSKGETRLNNPKNQESYFQQIFTRYMRFCNTSRDTLSAEFAKLSVSPSKWASSPGSDPSPELSLIHMSMRKLRESIHATRRSDDFARDAYLFIARASILTQSWEAYVPALTHLTRFICRPASSPKSQLSESDARAVASWMLLDRACRLSDFEGAIEIAYGRASLSKPEVNCVRLVRALIHGDFAAWNAIMKKVDGYAAAIASFAAPTVRKHALKCLAVTYLEVEKSWVEKCADMQWHELVKSEHVGWELVERVKGDEKVDIVIIRRVKA